MISCSSGASGIEVVVGEAGCEKCFSACLNEVVLGSSWAGSDRCGARRSAVFEELVACNACEGGVEE